MKKIVFSLMLLISVSGVTYGMNEVRVGIKTMALISNYTFSGVSNSDNETRTGVMAGMTVVFYPLDNVLIECEAMFSLGGYKTDIGEYTINSVKMPAIVVFAPVAFFGVYAGPCLNILATAKNPLNENIEKELSPLYFSIHAGAQVSFSESFYVDFRYIKGLNNASKDTDIDMKEQSLAIGIGLLF